MESDMLRSVILLTSYYYWGDEWDNSPTEHMQGNSLPVDGIRYCYEIILYEMCGTDRLLAMV